MCNFARLLNRNPWWLYVKKKKEEALKRSIIRPSPELLTWMSEKFLSHIIELLNRAQPDGLTFDALTFHLYNSEQDFFEEQQDLHNIATKVKGIIDTFPTHIICDERGAYHLKKGIPQQLFINFEAPQPQLDAETTINEPTIENYGEQLYLDLFAPTPQPESIEEPLASSPTSYSFPTLFDDDPYFE